MSAQGNTISPKLFRVIKIKQPKPFGFDLIKTSLRESKDWLTLETNSTEASPEPAVNEGKIHSNTRTPKNYVHTRNVEHNETWYSWISVNINIESSMFLVKKRTTIPIYFKASCIIIIVYSFNISRILSLNSNLESSMFLTRR